MKEYMAVTVARPTLPRAIPLPLWSPVLANEPSAPDEYVGHTEGAVLDDHGHVVAFLVRLAPKLAPSKPRTLVAASAIRITDESILQLSWSEDQLRAQPRLDDHLQPHNVVDGGPPVESRWMPARPAVVPPGAGVNVEEAARQGLEGGLAGVVVGAVAGLAIGGPLAAMGLAAFCAAGSGLAGILSGASQESAAQTGEMKFEDAVADTKRSVILQRLGRGAPRSRAPSDEFVEWAPFVPVTTPASSSEPSLLNMH